MESFSSQPWRDRGYHKDDSYHPAPVRQKFQGLLPTPSDGPGTRYPDPSEQRSWPRTDSVQRWEQDEDKWPSTYQPSPHSQQENGYVEHWESERIPPLLAERNDVAGGGFSEDRQPDFHPGPVSNWKQSQGPRDPSARRDMQHFPLGPGQRPKVRGPQDHRQYHHHRNYCPPQPGRFQDRAQFQDRPQFQESKQFPDRPQFQGYPHYPERTQYQDRVHYRDRFQDRTQFQERSQLQSPCSGTLEPDKSRGRPPPDFRTRPHSVPCMPSPQSSVESEGSPLPRDPRTKAFSHSIQPSSDSEGDIRERPCPPSAQLPPIVDGDQVIIPRDPREPRGRTHHLKSYQHSPSADFPHARLGRPRAFGTSSSVQEDSPWPNPGPQERVHERLPPIHHDSRSVWGSHMFPGTTEYHPHSHLSHHEHNSHISHHKHHSHTSHPPHPHHHDPHRVIDLTINPPAKSRREGIRSPKFTQPERGITSSIDPVCDRHRNLADPREAATRNMHPENRSPVSHREQSYPQHSRKAIQSHTGNQGQKGEADRHSPAGLAQTKRPTSGTHNVPPRREELNAWIDMDHSYCKRAITARNDVHLSLPSNGEQSNVHPSFPPVAEQKDVQASLSSSIEGKYVHPCLPSVTERKEIHPLLPCSTQQKDVHQNLPSIVEQTDIHPNLSSIVDQKDDHPSLQQSTQQSGAQPSLPSVVEQADIHPSLPCRAERNDVQTSHLRNDHNYVSQLDHTHPLVSLPVMRKAVTSPTSALSPTKLSPRLAVWNKINEIPGKRLPWNTKEQSSKRVLSLVEPTVSLRVEHECIDPEEIVSDTSEPSLVGFSLDLDPETSGESGTESIPESPSPALSLMVSIPQYIDSVKLLDSAVSVVDEGIKEDSPLSLPPSKTRLWNGRVYTTSLSLYASRKAPCRNLDDPLTVLSDRSSPSVICNRIQPCVTSSSSSVYGKTGPSLITNAHTPSSPSKQGSGRFSSVYDSSVILVEREPEPKGEEGDSDVEIIDTPSPPPSLRMEYRPTGRGRGGRRRKRGGLYFSKQQKRARKVLENSPSPDTKKRSTTFKASDLHLALTGQLLTLGHPRPHSQDFVPVILSTRSRAETATLTRRREMEEEIDMHERERISTARPGDEARLLATVGKQATGHGRAGSLVSQVDSSSGHSVSESLASSSKDLDSVRSSVLEEFSPDLIRRCKQMNKPRTKAGFGGSGDSALHRLCRSGKLEMARYLVLVEKAAVDAQDHAGWTPLHEACNNGHVDLAKFLLKSGADPNVGALDGTRAIHDAVETGMLEMVQVLVEHGADPCTEYLERTPCEMAQSLGHTEIVKYLQAKISERNKDHLHSISGQMPSSSAPPVPTRRQKRVVKQCSTDHETIFLPFDGYSEKRIGGELDYPLVYVSPVLEMSSEPMLPVYNITLSAGANPRKHNFYILSEVTKVLHKSADELVAQGIPTFTLPVEDFSKQTLSNPLTSHAGLLRHIQTLSQSNEPLVLAPVCTALRMLLGVELVNLDD